MLFPTSLSRYGPIAINRRKNGRRDSNGDIFRPYLNCEKSKENKPAHEKRMKRTGSNTDDNLGVGFSENLTVMEVLDGHDIFWAHEACLIWSRSTLRNISKNTEEQLVENIEENLKQVSDDKIYPEIHFQNNFRCRSKI